MRDVFNIFLILIIFVFNQQNSFAQQSENWLDQNDPYPYAKLYLHTDREIYFQGDSIWFKAYYLDGQTQQFIDGLYNLFADLIDEDGHIIQSVVIPLANGTASGYIKILKSMKPGSYALRAYTNIQKNYGEEAFFHKNLRISQVKSSIEMEEEELSDQVQKMGKIDVACMPEGGILLEGKMNIIGIKAIDEWGWGKSINGKIINSDGEIITSFTTIYKGLGKIHLNPQSGESYKIVIDNYPDFEYEIRDIKAAGIKLEFAGKTKDDILFRVITNSEIFHGKEYYFACMYRGEVLFYEKFVQTDNKTMIKVNQFDLRGGINRIVLLDEDLKPISERIFFSKNIEKNKLKISSNREKYNTRTNVNLNIYDEEYFIGNYSSLSVTVVDESSILSYGPSTNILSYLLIDSELKGNIEAPADYFVDDNSCSSDIKLDLLMITQGWSNYIWNDISGGKIVPDFKEEAGITINGSVQRLLSKKPVIDGDIVLGLFKGDNLKTYEGKTDINGRFSIDSVLFTDTALVFVQARNKKGKVDTRVFLDPIFERSPKVSELYFPPSKMRSELSIKLFRQKYFSELAMKEFKPEAGSIMLDEIIVSAPRIKNDDGQFGLHGQSRNTLEISPNIIHTSRDILNFIEGRVAGVIVTEDWVSIRGIGTVNGNPNPLYLLDGAEIPIDYTMPHPLRPVRNIPMSSIDKVEVIKDIDELAIYGVRGANGVIAIYTKRGIDQSYVDPYTRGVITDKLVGYSPYREFYSPKYTTENINSERPDNRLTLYWNPNVLTENGKASLSFFTSDDISNFKVYVEGITVDGRICLGTCDFSVDEYNQGVLE